MLSEETLNELALASAEVLDHGTNMDKQTRIAAQVSLRLIAEVRRLRKVLGIVAVGFCPRCELERSPERDCVHNLARHSLGETQLSESAQGET